MRLRLARHLTAILLLALFTAGSFASQVQAITPEQSRVFDDTVLFFNYRDQTLCGGSGASGPANIGVDKGFSLGADGRERRVNLVRALVADLGLTPEQASGIVGNFMQESGGLDLPPDVNEGGRKGPPTFSGGYGWAQWTGPRQTSFIDFAVTNGYMASRTVNATDAANYAYLKKELSEGYTSTVTEIKKTTTPEDAAVSFESTFEKAGSPNLAARRTFARQAFTEFSGGSGAATGGAATSGGSGGCAGALGDANCNDSASCAKLILALAAQGKFVLGPGARQNLETAAAGQQLTVCSNPGPVTLNAGLMQILIKLSATYKINLHNFSAPGHDCDYPRFHPRGRATDVSLVDVPADCASLGSHPQNRGFAQGVMDLLPPGGGLGQKQCIGPLNNTAGKRYFDDGDQHFHIDVGSEAP